MSLTALALLMTTPTAAPGTGTLWLDGEAHAVEVTLCDLEPETAGGSGTLEDGSIVTIMLQRWPGLRAVSVTYDNTQWVHRGPEDDEDSPDIRSWTQDGQLAASGIVAVFPPIRQDTMEVRFEGVCPA